MPESQSVAAAVGRPDEPAYTLREIFQQPLLWPTTVARVRAASGQLHLDFEKARVLLTGAGSSAYAASAVASAWPHAVAVPYHRPSYRPRAIPGRCGCRYLPRTLRQ